MTRPRRCFGTAFTALEVSRLQELLGLDSKADAASVAMLIHACVWHCERQDIARTRTPDIKAEKRRLGKIATAAAQLANLLDSEPLAENLVQPPGPSLDRADAMVNGALCMSTRRQIDRRKVASLIAVAKDVRRNADMFLADDRYLRMSLELPNRENVGKSAVTGWLWPNLFQIWKWSGRRVAKTEGGPLHRFVAFVHGVYCLGEVRWSTFKDSVIDWQRDAWWQRVQPQPPWRDAGED